MKKMLLMTVALASFGASVYGGKAELSVDSIPVPSSKVRTAPGVGVDAVGFDGKGFSVVVDGKTLKAHAKGFPEGVTAEQVAAFLKAGNSVGVSKVGYLFMVEACEGLLGGMHGHGKVGPVFRKGALEEFNQVVARKKVTGDVGELLRLSVREAELHLETMTARKNFSERVFSGEVEAPEFWKNIRKFIAEEKSARDALAHARAELAARERAGMGGGGGYGVPGGAGGGMMVPPDPMFNCPPMDAMGVPPGAQGRDMVTGRWWGVNPFNGFPYR
jgi:hypothetical protein